MDMSKVYVGLNDADTGEQLHETDRYVKLLKKVCQAYRIPFSFTLIQGGYMHEDGRYTEENTIEITFYDVPQETIDLVAGDLCVFFHQESVIIVSGEVTVRSVNERL